MYHDQTLARKNKVTVYLNQHEEAFIEAACKLYGTSKAQVLRELALREARDAFGIVPGSAVKPGNAMTHG